MSKRFTLAAAAMLGAMVAGVAVAQAPGPIAARQASFKDIGAQAKAFNDAMRAPAPDLAVVKAAAAKLKAHGAALPTWFPAGSGPASGVKTAAKTEIWTDAAGFATAAKAFADATVKLDQLAQAGDIEGLKAQQRVLGGACGGCHNKYREKPQ